MLNLNVGQISCKVWFNNSCKNTKNPGASNILAMVTVSFNYCCLINHHKSKCLNRQRFVISQKNDGWPSFLYCTEQCSFIKLRFNWVGRSKMAWLIGLTVEVGWHLKHHGSLPCGILSSSGPSWLLHMMVLGQSSKRMKMEAACLVSELYIVTAFIFDWSKQVIKTV